jgi:HlyD family secretion protein
MKKIFKIILIVVIVAIFLGTLGFLYVKSREKPQEFETKTPEKKNIVKKTVATGAVVPKREIEIVPKVSGIIDELYVVPGNKIKKGDLIAKIKIIPNMIQLSNAESRLEKAQISLRDARTEFDRQKKLFDDDVIAEAEFQQYQISLDNAKAEVRAAEDNLQLIKEGVTKQTGKTTNTLVPSTINGMVLDVPVEIGNSVIESNTFNPGSTVAIIADMGEMIFEGKVDEAEVGKIHEGMPITLTIGAIDDITFDALLKYISPKGVEENGAIQFEIKADIELIDTVFVRAGYSANANIVLDRRDSVMTIPENLLQMNEDSTFVEVETKESQMYEKRLIKTGLSDGIYIEVLEGLTMEDKIKVPK